MNSTQKDTIYIDVDDEITSIVEKVNKSKSKIVALVLPKRAAVLQSIVNMKLLKRASDEAGKRVVLISSEAGLMPLAGAVGVYVAKNLQSKPEIPSAPETPDIDDELLEAEEGVDDADADTDIDADKSVGELSGDENDEAVFESEAPLAAAATQSSRSKAKAAKPPKAPKAKKDKKNKVPNFDLFRKKVFIGAAVVAGLLALSYYAFFLAPKATIIVKTETTTSNQSIDFTASPTAQTVDVSKGIVPSKEVEAKKTDTQKALATGQKDLGTKATGSVTLTIKYQDCPGVCPLTVPAGSGISTGGLTFLTNEKVTLLSTGPNGLSGTVNVTAQANGDQYNLGSGKTFSVAGFSSVSGVNSSSFTGGTSKIAKVVSQQDVDSAKQKLTDSSQEVKDQLKKQLEDAGYYAITDTFTTKSENITVSPAVDQEATEVTVTADRVYVMTGVKRDDLHALVENSVQDEVTKRSLQIQNDGIDGATFKVGNRKDDGSVSGSMQVQVVLGPKINEDQLKKDVAGKKSGDVQNIVKDIDGVKDVEVHFSPFWVNIVPKNVNKITIKYEEANN